jgi:hypothetical protein
MAQTKVKLVSNGVVTVDNLHTNHGITTNHIGEGSVLYYTDARVQNYLTTNNYATQAYVSTTTTNSANWDTAFGWGNHASQGYATQTYVNTAVAGLVDAAPATLDTLNELAAALGDDPNFATTVSTSIGTKWTQDNAKISNWDTAYGWGNHASAGYQAASTAITTSNIGSQSVNFATTAGSTSYLSALADYVWNASTNGRDFPSGIQTSFVRAEVDGYPSYGSVVRVHTYSNDGGSAELYFPYSADYGGSSMRYRLGLYNNAGWTSWKTVIDSDNISSQSVSYATSAGNSSTTSQNVFTDLKINFHSGAGGGHSFSSNHYSMGLDSGNGAWSGPHYRDLIIGYHTGIRLGAGYSGIRFYNNSPTTDANNDGNGDSGEALLMTVGGYVGTANHTDVVVNNNLFANASMRAPIFYDSNNTAYFVDPASTSRLNDLYIQGGVGGLSNSATYTEAAIEVRERGFGGAQDETWATAPRIGFHWGGRVASQIALSSNGWINILNNPGNNYEGFRAGAIYSTGDVTAYYSDIRLKEIQGPIKNALNSVLSIDTFKYKNNDIAKQNGFIDDDVHIGVSAQSVEAVLPEVVKHAPFDIESKDGKTVSKTGEWYKTVQYEKLVPLLIEAIKEQQQQIDELKSLLNK